MGKHRFFLSQNLFLMGTVSLPGDLQNQMRNVLRLRPGDDIDLLDGSGLIFHAQIIQMANGDFAAQIIEQSRVLSEPNVKITLMFSLTRREKFEWILQKATEVGVSTFQPYVSSRSLVQQTDQFSRKEQRWKEILREAAEQSGRGRLPSLEAPLSLKQLIKSINEAQIPALAAWTDGTQVNLQTALANLGQGIYQLCVIIGPEGGFSQLEQEWMCSAAVQPFNLGKRTLRMETAAILASALVLYELGELSS